jgi:hypothetical protein
VTLDLVATPGGRAEPLRLGVDGCLALLATAAAAGGLRLLHPRAAPARRTQSLAKLPALVDAE